jgi:hypothetical protein
MMKIVQYDENYEALHEFIELTVKILAEYYQIGFNTPFHDIASWVVDDIADLEEAEEEGG